MDFLRDRTHLAGGDTREERNILDSAISRQTYGGQGGDTRQERNIRALAISR